MYKYPEERREEMQKRRKVRYTCGCERVFRDWCPPICPIHKVGIEGGCLPKGESFIIDPRHICSLCI